VDVDELWLIRDLSQTHVVVPHCLFQPREGAIGLTTERQHVGDVVGITVLVLVDQFSQCGIRRDCLTQCVVGDNLSLQALGPKLFLLHFRQCRLRLALE
jgi:hypothetical protein